MLILGNIKLLLTKVQRLNMYPVDFTYICFKFLQEGRSLQPFLYHQRTPN